MAATLTLMVEDMSGSVRQTASGISPDATVSDFVATVSRLMLMPEQEDGRPIIYGAQVDGEVLNPGDRLGDVAKEGGVVQLVRNVSAG